MDGLHSRFERIKRSCSAEIRATQSNEDDYTTFPIISRGDDISRNINYYRRALYSEVELFKMELEEYLGEHSSSESNENDKNDRNEDRNEGSSKLNSIPKSNISKNNSRSDILNPLNTNSIIAKNLSSSHVNDLEKTEKSDNYNINSVKSSTIYTTNKTYNDIDLDTNVCTDRDRLLDNTIVSTESKISKYSIIVDDSNDEKNNSEKKNNSETVLSLTKSGIAEYSSSGTRNSLEISQMIEECSLLSAKISLKFARRNPQW